LEGALAIDWEDIAIAARPDTADYVYVADTGDNDARDGLGARAFIQLYRFPEPEPTALAVDHAVPAAWEVASYHYPDAASDSEALFVDPQSGDPFVITKTNDGHCNVYRAPIAAFSQTEPYLLEWVAEFWVGEPYQSSAQVTAADISPSGDRILVRTYTSLFLYVRGSTWQETFGAPTLTLEAPMEPQGEAITFNAEGSAWFSASEQSTTLYRGGVSCE
jgi:hypothetical protein